MQFIRKFTTRSWKAAATLTSRHNQKGGNSVMSEKINEKPSGSRVNTAVRLINRVIRYMLHYYKIPFLIVVICILITAIATVVGATFPQTLIDDHITPMLESGSAVWLQT